MRGWRCEGGYALGGTGVDSLQLAVLSGWACAVHVACSMPPQLPSARPPVYISLHLANSPPHNRALQVDVKRTQRDLQQAEILGMSLKEQLAARNAELAQLRSEHGELQQRHAATGAELEATLGELGALRREHEVSQRAAAEARADMQRWVVGCLWLYLGVYMWVAQSGCCRTRPGRALATLCST